MRTLAYLPAILLVAPICTATAQDRTSPPEPGQRVRVTAPSLGLDGHEERFSGVRGDTLVLTSMRCLIADVERLDVHAGRRSHAVTGGLIGLAAGVLIGIPVGALEQSRYECDPDNAWAPCIPPLPTIPIMFGVIGGVLGAVTGGFIKTDRWQHVPLDQLRVSVVPQRDGRLVLAVSVAF
jgi:ABC-type nitrate/sulfonate/bicarbonate transport system permease component